MDNVEFIKQSNKIHMFKYDYSKVNYTNDKTKVCIICFDHGEFYQKPSDHLKGHGCRRCGDKIRSKKTAFTKEVFIIQARKIHGDKYDYSKVEYVNSRTKVCIICSEHGEFWQTPHSHLDGHGCKKCGLSTKSKKLKKNTDEFIIESILIHNDKYDYSKCVYNGVHTKVCIICSEHGEFWQTPHTHLKGHGCPKCANNALNNEKFITMSNLVHNNYYDYSLADVNNKNRKDKIRIICPKHGIFEQTIQHHLSGHKCPKCSHDIVSQKKMYCINDFIEKSKQIHNDKYTYSSDNYNGRKNKIKIFCPIHGDFYQNPHDHLQGHGCPKCGIISSKAENEITGLLKLFNVQQRNREFLNGKEIDIYIPSLKLGIEYNGLLWHSEKFGKDKYYHIGKLNECNTQGIKLIQIFEDEWVNHRKICESKLGHICGLDTNKTKIFARKCQIREIKNKEAKEFLNQNHIQGFASATVYLGCFYNEQLVGVMSFKKEKEGYWDLNRFATDINYNCIGVGGKLFKYFTKNYDYQEIKSFADRRWTTNPTDNLYTKLGFEFVEFTRPDYRYYDGKTCERHHKFGFRKQILHKRYGLPLTMTENEMTKELGYTRIWDCGLIKYIYYKKHKKEWWHN